MGWIKEANKRGWYKESRAGFRIYTIRHSQRHVYFVDRPDGRYRVTEFIKGFYRAINKDGKVLEAHSMEELWFKIDLHKYFY